ncbi:MAG: hypothetical protein K5694_01650 [Bacilli bacterium]|nr:hypothetical protein [Bacilli bacterium]
MKQKKIYLLSALAITMMLAGCGNNSGTSSSVTEESFSLSEEISSISEESLSESEESSKEVSTTYSLTAVSNGNVSFLVEGKPVTKAKEGEKVLISSSSLMKNISSIDVEIISSEEGYYFIMAAKEVTIYVGFEGEKFHVRSLTYMNTNLSSMSGYAVDSTGDAAKKKTIYFSSSLKKHNVDYLLLVNGKEFPAVYSEEDEAVTADVILPEGEVDIIVGYRHKSLSSGTKVTFNEIDGITSLGLVNGGYYSYSKTTSLNLYLIPEYGFKINRVYAVIDGGTEVDLSKSSYEKYEYSLSLYSYQTSKNIEIIIEHSSYVSRKVTIANAESYRLELDSAYEGLSLDKVVPGEHVGFTLYLLSSEGDEKLVNITSSIEMEITTYQYEGGLHVNFTMPDADITLTPVVATPKEITYSLIEGITSISITNISGEEIISAYPGDRVYVYPTMEEGSAMNHLYYGEGLEATYTPGTYTWAAHFEFIMPNESVTLTFGVSNSYSLTVPSSIYYTSSVYSGEYGEGSDVSITIAPVKGYQIDSVSLEGLDVEVNKDGNVYSFVMPSCDVTIAITCSEAPRTYVEYSLPEHLDGFTIKQGYQTISSGDFVTAGTEIKVCFDMAFGYTFTGLSVSDGSEVTATSETDNYDYAYTLIAQEGTISFEVSYTTSSRRLGTFEIIDGLEISTIKQTFGTESGTKYFYNDNPTSFNFLVGAEVTLSFAYYGGGLSTVTDVSVYAGEKKIASTYETSNILNDVKFTMPDSEIRVVFDTKIYQSYAVHFAGLTSNLLVGDAWWSGDEDYHAYNDGDLVLENDAVYIELQNLTAAQFAEKTWTVIVVNANDEVIYTDTFSYLGASRHFTMPSSEVTITLTASDIE